MSRTNTKTSKTAGKLLIVACLMFGFGFALVPLYGLLCNAFGINGRFLDIESGNYTATEGKQRSKVLVNRLDESRNISVEFLTTLNKSMNWEFKAMKSKVSVHPGEVKTVRFYAKNLTNETVVAQAVPSLVPGTAVKYFTKMECFCFSQQTFKPGEAREMPLIFVVDPDLPKKINTISLGYTFFNINQFKENEPAKNLALVQ